jgi:hypothetical protein
VFSDEVAEIRGANGFDYIEGLVGAIVRAGFESLALHITEYRSTINAEKLLSTRKGRR